MFEKFSHVLTTEKNRNLLIKCIKDIGLSYNYNFHDDDIYSSLDVNLKDAIDNNIVGSKYLTNSSLLKSANLHIALKSSKDLKELYSLKLKSSSLSENIKNKIIEQDIDMSVNHYSRRKEIKVDRLLEPPRRDDAPIVIRKMTPRELLKD